MQYSCSYLLNQGVTALFVCFTPYRDNSLEDGKYPSEGTDRAPIDIYSSRTPSPSHQLLPSVHVSGPLTTKPPQPAPRKGNSSSLSSHSSDSGSDNELVFRKRTTSIVENKLVSADYNSRSCEDLTKVAGPILKTLQESSPSGTHSDSEISPTRLAKVQNGVNNHHKSKLGWRQKSATAITKHEPSTASYPPLHKPPTRERPCAYDHLDLKQGESSPLSSPEPESTASLPAHPSFRKNYDTLEPKDVRPQSSSSDEEEERTPKHYSNGTMQYQVFEPLHPSSSQHKQSKKRTNTYDRKVRVTGRIHTYEQVDLAEDRPSSSCSSGTSPEPSPTQVYTPPTSMRAWQYHRKVEVTGHIHTYECVDPLNASTPGPEIGVTDSQQPGKLQSDNEPSFVVKRSKKVSPEMLSSSKKPLPLQFVPLGQSEESVGLSTVVEEETSVEVARVKQSPKKPCPLPRSRDSPPSTQRPPFRTSRSVEEEPSPRQSPTRFSHGHASTSNGKRTGARPTRSSAPSRPPPLPPKPSLDHLFSRHQRSRSEDSENVPEAPPPSRPPRSQHRSSFDRENRPLPNYTQICVSTLPVRSPAPYQLSRSKNERNKTSLYTEINHVATFQLGTMIEARNLEKELATLPKQ